MKTQTETKTDNRSEQQAIAQLESIVEMVRAMDKEATAKAFASNLSREQCSEILSGATISDNISYNDSDVESLRESLATCLADDTIEAEGFEFDEESARERIQEDPLSVEVRSGWYAPGASDDDRKPFEFTILLCTGGPACRLIGELDDHMQPDRVRIQHQDWGTPWTEYFPTTKEQREALLTYCQQFYFGE